MLLCVETFTACFHCSSSVVQHNLDNVKAFSLICNKWTSRPHTNAD